MTSCAVERTATAESVKTTTNFTNLTNERDSVVVAVYDTVTITKTITVQTNDMGDTLRVNMVTDRERVRDRSQLKVKSEKVKVVRDTVYVATRDPVFVRNTNLTNGSNRASPFVSALKWIFWIVVAIGGLIITITITKTIRK